MTDIKDFLTLTFENYLFKDIESMLEIQDEQFGGCSFPIVTAVLSGIELAGALIDQRLFNQGSSFGNKYFKNYWEKCLSQRKVCYDVYGLYKIFRQLIRNGVAHQYILKPNVSIDKGFISKDGCTLRGNPAGKLLSVEIHARPFYEDFKESYEYYIKPIVFANKISSLTKIETIEVRLKEIEDAYVTKSKTTFDSVMSSNSNLILDYSPLSSNWSGTWPSGSNFNANI